VIEEDTQEEAENVVTEELVANNERVPETEVLTEGQYVLDTVPVEVGVFKVVAVTQGEAVAVKRVVEDDEAEMVLLLELLGEPDTVGVGDREKVLDAQPEPVPELFAENVPDTEGD
jgi:aminoglycoside/choline kinase family phosphotransferase